MPINSTEQLSVQDDYNQSADDISTKYNQIISLLNQALDTTGNNPNDTWFINFTSASGGLLPYTFAQGGVYEGLDEQVAQDLASFHAGRVGTIVMDFPEQDLIDDVIGENWPFITISSPSVANFGTDTLTLHGMEAGQQVTFYVGTDGTSQGSLGPVTDNGDGTYTATFTATQGGTPASILATIDGETVASPYPTITVTVPTTTTVTNGDLDVFVPSNNPTVVLSASVAPTNIFSSAIVNQGTVTFTILNQDDSTVVATLPGNAVANGSASVLFNAQSLAQGTYLIHAAYVPAATDPQYGASAANVLIVTLNVEPPDSTTTTVTSTALTEPFSTGVQQVTVAAAVTGGGGEVVGQGTVSFALFDANGDLVAAANNPVVNGSASGTLAITDLALGAYRIHATYVPSPANAFTGSADSADGTLTVVPADTTTLVASLNVPLSTAGAMVTLSAVVSSAGGNVDQGTVNFTILNGTRLVATLSGKPVADGTASAPFSTAGLVFGHYAIHAAYVPATTAAEFAASADSSDGTLAITHATTTHVTSTGLVKPYSTTNQIVTLSATVGSANVAVNEGTVTFTVLDASGDVIVTRTGIAVINGHASASYAVSGLGAGSYHFHAAYTPAASNPLFAASADSVDGTLKVVAAATTTVVTSTGLKETFSTASQVVTLSAAVSFANQALGGKVADGTVTFSVVTAGGRVVTTLSGNTVTNGMASVSYDLAGPAAGSYHIRAAYVPRAANPNFAASTAASSGTLVVARDSTNTVVTSTAVTGTFSHASEPVTLSATVSAGSSALGGVVNQGTVTFTLINAHGQDVATVHAQVVSGQASTSVDLKNIPAGDYRIHAVYVPDPTSPDFTSSADAGDGTLTVAA